MFKFISIVSSILASTIACSLGGGGLRDIGDELPWTNAINGRLCTPGAHPDSVARQFFACYNEEITPGGSAFVECQPQFYGVELNSEANLDKACSLPNLGKLINSYTVCLNKKLVSSGHNIVETWHKLNECQGAALGVPPPQPESSVTSIDKMS